MVGRVLLVLAALAVMGGCGQASAPSEKQEKEAARADNDALSTDFHSSDHVKEGEAIELSITDPSVGFEYAFDCNIDDAKGYDAPFLKQLTADSGPIGFSCRTSDAGMRNVGVKIRDKRGDVTEYTNTVEIGSAAPVVHGAPDQSADVDTRRSFDLGSFRDAAGDGPWEVTVNWGDGSPETGLQANTPDEQLAARHTYADRGAYTVTVKVAEASGTQVGSGDFGVVVYHLTPVFAQEVEGRVPHYLVSDCTIVGRGQGVGSVPWCFNVKTEADDEEALVRIIEDIVRSKNLNAWPDPKVVKFEFYRSEGMPTAYAVRDEALAEDVLSAEVLRHATVINGVYLVPSE